ncbi:MAG: site-2 protease family protein, partial [Streptococcus mitis]|nr:site-2 protease family protein [Streptococcus mitis]
MLGILTFILVFGIIVVVHEFGHFYFAKKSGILVREFAIGMGPKIFAHIGKDGTAYT